MADRNPTGSSSTWTTVVVASLVSIVSIDLTRRYYTRKLQQVEQKLSGYRQEERTGRIRAETKLRTLLKQQRPQETSPDSISIRPIGTVVSPFTKRMGTPRQPQLVPDSKAFIELRLPSEYLDGIAEYSHAWLIFEFHANTDTTSTPKAKIRPPRAPNKVGCLATRSPHRPNNLGLSIVRLEKLEQRRLYISCVDLVHGTPIYDIKPVVPWDTMVQPTVPAWVRTEVDMRDVQFAPPVGERLAQLVRDGKFLPLYDKCEDVLRTLEQILAQDPRGAKLRGTTNQETYNLVFWNYQVSFVVPGPVVVTDIQEATFTEYVDGIPLVG